MTISLQSLHQPLNDFFVNQFSTGDDAPVMFRFDKFGSVLSDADFRDELHPELGYLPALARERFSELVNRVPVDAGDDLNVILTASAIDSTYFFGMLKPAIPFIATGSDESVRAAITDAFNAVKAQAVKTYDSLTLESITGLMLEFKPSLATPEDWFDPSKDDVWTSHSLEVTDPTPNTTPTPQTDNDANLWRLQPSPTVVETAFELPPIKVEPERLIEVEQSPAPGPDEVAVETARAIEVDRPLVARNMLRAAPLAHRETLLAAEHAPLRRAAEAQARPVRDDTFERRFQVLSVRDRIRVQDVIADETPTEPVKTQSLSISFDYCVVNIRRPWFMDAFVNQLSWWIPGTPKGHITDPGAGNLSLLPIGLVVIRDLAIAASWTDEDVTNASQATGFGPFKVGTEIVEGKLSHPGLQTIGWLVQKLPVLPPNDAPT